jgi:hypothetical protein
MTLASLPADILVDIFGRLGSLSLRAVHQTCKVFRHLTNLRMRLRTTTAEMMGMIWSEYLNNPVYFRRRLERLAGVELELGGERRALEERLAFVRERIERAGACVAPRNE